MFEVILDYGDDPKPPKHIFEKEGDLALFLERVPALMEHRGATDVNVRIRSITHLNEAIENGQLLLLHTD